MAPQNTPGPDTAPPIVTTETITTSRAVATLTLSDAAGSSTGETTSFTPATETTTRNLTSASVSALTTQTTASDSGSFTSGTSTAESPTSTSDSRSEDGDSDRTAAQERGFYALSILIAVIFIIGFMRWQKKRRGQVYVVKPARRPFGGGHGTGGGTAGAGAGGLWGSRGGTQGQTRDDVMSRREYEMARWRVRRVPVHGQELPPVVYVRPGPVDAGQRRSSRPLETEPDLPSYQEATTTGTSLAGGPAPMPRSNLGVPNSPAVNSAPVTPVSPLGSTTSSAPQLPAGNTRPAAPGEPREPPPVYTVLRD